MLVLSVGGLLRTEETAEGHEEDNYMVFNFSSSLWIFSE